jgi:hypothetical protein
MATLPSPLRIDPELTRSAEPVASRMSRSVPEQIAHWARIGRELERSADVSVVAVNRVLEGAAQYDALPAREQALVRAAWLERIDELRAGLDLAKEYAAAGYRYAELEPGTTAVTIHEPKAAYAAGAGGKRKVRKRAARR